MLFYSQNGLTTCSKKFSFTIIENDFIFSEILMRDFHKNLLCAVLRDLRVVVEQRNTFDDFLQKIDLQAIPRCLPKNVHSYLRLGVQNKQISKQTSKYTDQSCYKHISLLPDCSLCNSLYIANFLLAKIYYISGKNLLKKSVFLCKVLR